MKNVRLGILMWLFSCMLPFVILGISIYYHLNAQRDFKADFYIIPAVAFYGFVLSLLFSLPALIAVVIFAKKRLISNASLMALNAGMILYSLLIIYYTVGFDLHDELIYPVLVSLLLIISSNVFLWLQGKEPKGE